METSLVMSPNGGELAKKEAVRTLLTPHGKRPRMDDVPRGEGIISAIRGKVITDDGDRSTKKRKKESQDNNGKVSSNMAAIALSMNGSINIPGGCRGSFHDQTRGHPQTQEGHAATEASHQDRGPLHSCTSCRSMRSRRILFNSYSRPLLFCL
jgi:hypothetical protein